MLLAEDGVQSDQGLGRKGDTVERIWRSGGGSDRTFCSIACLLLRSLRGPPPPSASAKGIRN